MSCEFNKDLRKIMKEHKKLYDNFCTPKYRNWKKNVIQLGEKYGIEEVCWFLERKKGVDIIGNNKITFILDKFTKLMLPIIITFLTSSLITGNNDAKERDIAIAIVLIFVALVIIIAMNIYFNKNYTIRERFYDDCLDILRN
ncbi:MAG: hypothetical protein ACLR6B_03245 [Blautia sp.]